MLAAVFAFLLAATGAASGRDLAEGGAREYGVKAAFVYNFTKFVEWPAESFKTASSPFVIGVLDCPPLLSELEKAVRGRKINGRAIVVQSFRSVTDVSSPHVLFVGRGSSLTPELARRSSAGSVLTVGESERFLEEGGVIAFAFEADKLRFKIDMTAATRAKLRVSAQLQKLAQAVVRND